MQNIQSEENRLCGIYRVRNTGYVEYIERQENRFCRNVIAGKTGYVKDIRELKTGYVEYLKSVAREKGYVKYRGKSKQVIVIYRVGKTGYLEYKIIE